MGGDNRLRLMAGEPPVCHDNCRLELRALSFDLHSSSDGKVIAMEEVRSTLPPQPAASKWDALVSLAALEREANGGPGGFTVPTITSPLKPHDTVDSFVSEPDEESSALSSKKRCKRATDTIPTKRAKVVSQPSTSCVLAAAKSPKQNRGKSKFRGVCITRR